MSYIVKKKNRVLRIPEEKAEEYAKMGYEVADEDGEVVMKGVVTSVAEAQGVVSNLQKENEELKAKLKEATLYAEDADKKIADLRKENEELKAAIQAQATMGSAASVSEDSGKKKTTKTSKQSE